MSKYADNDDDLFDYDPTLDVKPKETFSNLDNKSSTSELLNSIKDNLNNDIESLTGNLAPNKYKFAASFNMAYHMFLHEPLQEATTKTISIVLNTLTNGDYNLMNIFYETEIKISRKIFFLELVDRAFDDGPEEENLLLQINKLLNIDITDIYIRTCFRSTINLCKHSLELDKALYLALSKRLGIPVQQELFEPIVTSAAKDHKVYLQDYKRDIMENINNQLIDAGVLDEVKEIFGTDVNIVLHHEK